MSLRAENADGSCALSKAGARPASLRLSRVVEFTCWVFGLGLLLFYLIVRGAGAAGSQLDVQAFERANITSGGIDSATSLATDDISRGDFSLWSAARLEEYRRSVGEVTAPPVALLQVRSLNMKVPVYADTSDQHLNRGAGLIEGMAMPGKGGNLGIAGHRDGFFRVLKDVRVGEDIEIAALGRIYRYRVASIEIVAESDTSLLHGSIEPMITLVTCYPFYYQGHAPQRFVVQGIYQDSFPINDESQPQEKSDGHQT